MNCMVSRSEVPSIRNSRTTLILDPALYTTMLPTFVYVVFRIRASKCGKMNICFMRAFASWKYNIITCEYPRYGYIYYYISRICSPGYKSNNSLRGDFVTERFNLSNANWRVADIIKMFTSDLLWSFCTSYYVLAQYTRLTRPIV